MNYILSFYAQSINVLMCWFVHVPINAENELMVCPCLKCILRVNRLIRRAITLKIDTTHNIVHTYPFINDADRFQKPYSSIKYTA